MSKTLLLLEMICEPECLVAPKGDAGVAIGDWESLFCRLCDITRIALVNHTEKPAQPPIKFRGVIRFEPARNLEGTSKLR
jgi:hypothetical protein